MCVCVGAQNRAYEFSVFSMVDVIVFALSPLCGGLNRAI